MQQNSFEENGSGLSDKVAVIIGGTGGIGSAASHLLAKAGARVVVNYRRSSDKAERLIRSLPGDGHAAFQADIEDSASLERFASEVGTHYGRTDVLVNSAGMTQPVPHSDLDGLSDELIDRVFRANWRGPFAAVRAFHKLLTADGGGVIVNISSIAATTGIGSNIAYCGAKAGLDIMGVALARALAPEIRVVTVSPGVIDTSFVPGRDRAWSEKQAQATPLKRLTSPQDCAQAILAAVTQLVFTTGSVITVDGGRHL